MKLRAFGAHHRLHAREAFRFGEAAEVANVFLHVIGKSFPKFARLVLGHWRAVDEHFEGHETSTRISVACLVTSTVR